MAVRGEEGERGGQSTSPRRPPPRHFPPRFRGADIPVCFLLRQTGMSAPRRVETKPKADKNVRPTSGVGRTFLSACCFGRQECPPHVGLRQSPRQTRMSAPRRVWGGHSCLPAASADRNVRPTSG